jgi:hypothetical protein
MNMFLSLSGLGVFRLNLEINQADQMHFQLVVPLWVVQ